MSRYSLHGRTYLSGRSKHRFMIGALTVLLLLVPAVFGLVYHSSAEVIDITVTEKDRTTGEDGHWIVFTDGEVLANKDSLFFFKFNSSDVQNQLTVNQTHTVRVAGWRIPLFSAYRNIIEVRP